MLVEVLPRRELAVGLRRVGLILQRGAVEVVLVDPARVVELAVGVEVLEGDGDLSERMGSEWRRSDGAGMHMRPILFTAREEWHQRMHASANYRRGVPGSCLAA